MINIVYNHFDKNLWNETAIHPLQSWQWGEARKKMGIEILRMGEYTNKQITNVFQLTLHHIPYTPFKIGYLPRSKFPSKDVLEFLYYYGKKNNLIFIKIEPSVFNKVTMKQFNNLIPSPHPLFPSWSQIIDLTRPEDELLKNMRHKTRYNVRLAQKKGVTVKEMSNISGFEIFAKLYFETCKRQKYFGHDYNYHKIVWENLKKEIAHILVALYKNTPLAAYELFHFKDTVYYPYGGTSLEYRNFMASNLLMWESILLGKKLGAKKFDMWGSLQPSYNQDNPWAGFTRFKEGYGGKFIELIGSYDLVTNDYLYKLYTLAQFARNYYLQLKRLI